MMTTDEDGRWACMHACVGSRFITLVWFPDKRGGEGRGEDEDGVLPAWLGLAWFGFASTVLSKQGIRSNRID